MSEKAHSEVECSPTERVRAMLDERGIEHYDHENGEPLRKLEKAGQDPATSWTYNGANYCVIPNEHGTFDVWIDHATPEQVIAATVGEEHEMHICKRCGVAYELNIIDKGFGKSRFCPNCGYKELYQ